MTGVSLGLQSLIKKKYAIINNEMNWKKICLKKKSRFVLWTKTMCVKG